jgi:hypothetical protein
MDEILLPGEPEARKGASLVSPRKKTRATDPAAARKTAAPSRWRVRAVSLPAELGAQMILPWISTAMIPAMAT